MNNKGPIRRPVPRLHEVGHRKSKKQLKRWTNALSNALSHFDQKRHNSFFEEKSEFDESVREKS